MMFYSDKHLPVMLACVTVLWLNSARVAFAFQQDEFAASFRDRGYSGPQMRAHREHLRSSPMKVMPPNDPSPPDHMQQQSPLLQAQSRLPIAKSNVTQEISNQVLSYEGPATAPSQLDNSNGIGSGYYFSSTVKKPRERASNAWWAIGIGQNYETAMNLTSATYLDFCEHSGLLVTQKQRALCRSHPQVIRIVAKGLRTAIDECQTRFAHSRWNCTLITSQHATSQSGSDSIELDAHHIQDASTSLKTSPFGEVLRRPNRERSFLNAIFAAGLAHAMTKACSRDELPGECSCDKRIRSKSLSSGRNANIEWVACSDDIDYGAKFSREFTDNTHDDTGANDDDPNGTSAMVNSHNYEVGRRIFKSATDITCTCHGENGLCQTKRCWKHLGPFSYVGDELVRRYEAATHVQTSSKDPHKLRPVRRGVRRPKRKDLIYIEESPDYCVSDERIGVIGTQNRSCNSTSSGPDSCSLLCCGRGYQMVFEEIEEDCNCKFVWCCQIQCEKCKRQVVKDLCN